MTIKIKRPWSQNIKQPPIFVDWRDGILSQSLVDEINSLKAKRRAVILAHNYQRQEIQEIADYTGDSLGLSRQATSLPAPTIVFCGVHFMAETAYILNPHKTILLPDPRAGCPLAETIDVDGLRHLKSRHPGVPVVCYVNSSAAIKAESDICCTSANAIAVVESLPEDKVIFIPDKNLGKFVASRTSKEIILWPGFCPTHHRIKKEQILKLKDEYPQAKFVAHPECEPAVLALADEICSTSGMFTYARKTDAKVIIIGSEMGMLYRLQKENPDKTFLFPSKHTICPNMKLTTLEKVYRSLIDLETKVTVPEDIRTKAWNAVQRMMDIG